MHRLLRLGLAGGLAASLVAPASSQTSDPDRNNDGTVNILDVSLVSSCLGQTPAGIPEIEIVEPVDGSVVASSPVVVSGSVSDAAVNVDVNGIAAVLFEGSFSADGVSLVPGDNTITATAMTAPNPCVAADTDEDGDVDMDDLNFVVGSFGQNGFPVGDPDSGVRSASATVHVALDVVGPPPPVDVGVIAGRVYDDTTGLPLAAAEIRLLSLGDERFESPLAVESDALGRFRIASASGRAELSIEKDGFTKAHRVVNVVEGRRTDPRDARLTPVDAGATILSLLGGETSDASGNARLAVPAAALDADREIHLTLLSPQGLAGPLPRGWSPAVVFDLSPEEVVFGLPAEATIALPLAPPGSEPLPVARWNDERARWIAVALAPRTAGEDRIGLELDRGGQYVLLQGDQLPESPPPVTIGEPVLGVAVPEPLPQSLSASLLPSPRLVFAGPDASARVGVHVASSAMAPSGTVFETDYDERFRYVDDTNLYPEPREQDFTLYRFPPTGRTSFDLASEFPVFPSPGFESERLELGVIDVGVRMPVDPSTPRGTVVDARGGVGEGADGARLRIPPGATNEPLPVLVSALTETSFPALVPAGSSYVGGALVDFNGGALEASARLALSAPANVTAGEKVLLTRIVAFQAVSHLALVAGAGVEGTELSSNRDPLGDGSVLLAGVLEGGRFAFLEPDVPLGFVSGTVTGSDGRPLAGALVTVDTFGVVALTDAEGHYVLAVPIGSSRLTVIDPITDDRVTTNVSVSAPESPVDSDLELRATPPSVISMTPAPGSTGISLTAAIRVTFSEPLDAASVTPSSLVVADGVTAVAGAVTLDSTRTLLSFRPDTALASHTTYQVTVAGSLRDPTGHAMGAPFVGAFTTVDVTPPPPPPAGALSATIPDETGTTRVTGSQGTIEPGGLAVVRNLTTGALTTVSPEADGSFQALVEASAADRLELLLRDAAGNETVVPLGPFRDPDGSVVVGSEGGHVDGPGGIFVDIPPGALPDGTILRLDLLLPSELPIPPPAEFPFAGGVRLDLGGVVPNEPLDLGVPAPAGASPADQVLVGRTLDLATGPAWTVVDRAHLEDGSYVTASPPFPGVDLEGTYSFLVSEHDCLSYVRVTWQLEEQVILLPDLLPFVYLTLDVHEEGPIVGLCDTELDIEVRDPDTNAFLRTISRRTPPERDAIAPVPELLTDDSEPPLVVQSNVFSGRLIRDVLLRFSEPMQPESVESGFRLLDSAGFALAGEVALSDANRIAVFRPASPLTFGERHFVSLVGLRDLAGNFLEATEIPFTPFRPPDPLSELGAIPDFVDFIDKCRADGSCRKSTRDAALVGTTLFLANGLGSPDEHYRDPADPRRLLVVDVTDPRSPVLIGWHQTMTNPLAVEVATDVSLGSGSGFRGDLLVVAGGGRVAGGELAGKIEIYDASACTLRPVLAGNCLEGDEPLLGWRLLSTPAGTPPRGAVPADWGVPLQLALLHQRAIGSEADTLIAYTATSVVGLEAVDVVEAIGEFTGGPDGLMQGDYLDVGVLKSSVVALATDFVGGSALKLFTAQLGARSAIGLPSSAARLFPVENFVVDLDEDGNLGSFEDADQDGIAGRDEIFDLLALGSGPLSEGDGCASVVPCGELTFWDLSSRTDLAGPPTANSLGHPEPPSAVARIPLPGAAFSIQVDPNRLVAYVELRGRGLAIVDISSVAEALRSGLPATELRDDDEDGVDDRLVAIVPKTDIFSGETTVDFARGHAYVNGSVSGTDIVRVSDECQDLLVDFDIPHEEPPELGTQRDRLFRLFERAMDRLRAADEALVFSTGFMEVGSGSCFWDVAFHHNAEATCFLFDPERSDHDVWVVVPDNRVEQVQGILDGFAADVRRENGIDARTIQSVTFFAVPKDTVRSGNLGLNPPENEQGDVEGDLGLGRQSLLFQAAFDGARQIVPTFGIGTEFDNVVSLLREPTEGVGVPGEASGIPLLEGYELSLLQEFNILKSGALLRMKGYCESESRSFHPVAHDCEAQLRTVGEAAIRAAFARLVADERFNPSLILPADLKALPFNGEQCHTGVEDALHPPNDPAGYLEKRCTSFAEHVLSSAVQAVAAASQDPTVDDPFPGWELSDLFRFYCVKVGPQGCVSYDEVTRSEIPLETPLIGTDLAADELVADALRFVRDVQGATEDEWAASVDRDTGPLGNVPFLAQIHDLCLEVGRDIEAATPRSELRRCTRELAERALDGTETLPDRVQVIPRREEQRRLEGVLGLRRYVALDLRTRVVNRGSETLNDLLLSLFEGDDQGNYQPGTLRDVVVHGLQPATPRIVEREPDPEGAEGDTRPIFHAIFDMDEVPFGPPRALAFVLDPERDIPEANRADNTAGFFYYRLDVDFPAPPNAPDSVPSPVDTSPFPGCLPTPELGFTTGLRRSGPLLPLEGVRELTVGIYEQATLTYVLRNPNDFPLRKVTVQRAGQTVAFIPELPPGVQEIHTESLLPTEPGSQFLLAVATAEDPEGNILPRELESAVLHVNEDVQTFRVRFFDASPLNDLDHPFSRWGVNREPGTGQSREIVGAVTDGAGRIRVEIDGLIGGDTVEVSLEDHGLAGVTEGVGLLQSGEVEIEQEGTTLAGLEPDENGHLTVFYLPPSVFVRETFRAEDSNWPASDFKPERFVKLRVTQPDVGASVRRIRLRRPPVFLVHGFWSRRTDWNTFQPLVPPEGVGPDKYGSVKGFDGRFDVFAVGWDLWSEPFSELAPNLAFDLGAGVSRYLPGYALGKLDVVAHSMGGVLIRKLVREDDRIAASIRKFVSITSPHQGSRAAAKLLEIRSRRPLKSDIAQSSIVDPLGTGMDLFGDLPTVTKTLVQVEWCTFGMQLLAAVPESFIEGAIDDLDPVSAEIQALLEAPIRVPSHYVYGVTIPPPDLTSNPVFHMGETTFYQGLWSTLGIFCNVTPDEDTLEATKLIQDIKEIVSVLISVGKASSVRNTAKRRKQLLELLKKAFKKYNSEVMFPSDPEVVFGALGNDRLIAEDSQRGRIPLPVVGQQFALTEVVGFTDHQGIKVSPNLNPDYCLGSDSDGPLIIEDVDVVGDGTLDSVCKVLHLLEADPEGDEFFLEDPP